MNRRQFLIRATTTLVSGVAVAATWPRVSSAAARRPGSAKKAQIAIIIDDIGFSRTRARRFLSLGVPLTFSVLPRITYTQELADTLYAAGYEIMLHQPMEPVDSNFNPGPGAVYTSNRPQEIVAAIEENISEIPHVIGLNNHMGSKFTADQDKMREVLGVVKSKRLFFVDSLTTCCSKGYPTASRLGITAGRRNVFLDNTPSVPAIVGQLDKLQRVAMKKGKALAIGHPFPETAAAIDLFARRFKKETVALVPVSRVL